MAAPLTVVIFGASGDLTARKLVPALYNLGLKGRLPEGTKVLGVARTENGDEGFREAIGKKVRDFAAAAKEGFDEAKWAEFAANLHYVATDVTKPDGMTPITKWFESREGSGGGQRLFYLSISPELYPQVSDSLGAAGFNKEEGGFRRVIVEKPFGHDLATAKSPQQVVARHLARGPDLPHRPLPRQGNRPEHPDLPLRQHDVRAALELPVHRPCADHRRPKTVTVGKRGAYYDNSGVLRDMFQSHLLQVMALDGDGKPRPATTADNLRNEKVKVLDSDPPCRRSSTRPASSVERRAVRGIHGASPACPPRLEDADLRRGEAVCAITAVGRTCRSTSAAARGLKNALQRGVHPVPLPAAPHVPPAAGRDVAVQPHDASSHTAERGHPFELSNPRSPSVDGVQLQPRDLVLQLQVKPSRPEALPEAYERLLLDAIQGDASRCSCGRTRSNGRGRSWTRSSPPRNVPPTTPHATGIRHRFRKARPARPTR